MSDNNNNNRSYCALYSKECIEMLERIFKKAEKEHEETSFSKYYEAKNPEESQAVTSSDDDEQNAELSLSSDGEDDDDDQDDNGEEQDSEQEKKQKSLVKNNDQDDETAQQTRSKKQKKKKVPPNIRQAEREWEALLRQLGNPPCLDFLVPSESQNENEEKTLHLPMALLSKSERLSYNPFVQSKAYYNLAKELTEKNVLVILLRSGRFAGAVFRGNKCIVHTTSTRYTIRKGQGKAQSSQDGKRRPKSVGSQLRRAGEEALRQDVFNCLASWKTHIDPNRCPLVLLSCPRVMLKGLFHQQELFSKDDVRIRHVPLDVGRPTFESARAVHQVMLRAEWKQTTDANNEEHGEKAIVDEVEDVTGNDNDAEGMENVSEEEEPPPPLGRLHELARDGNLTELIQYLESNDADLEEEINVRAGNDEMTPLHYATQASVDPATAAACVSALLLKGRADPCIVDARFRPPYFLANHEKIRDAFRVARATLGEDYCQWTQGAKVGPPLLDPDGRKAKAAEKKKRQRARQKEKRAKERLEAQKQEEERKQKEEQIQQEETAKRIRDGLQAKSNPTATNVCDFCQKVCRGKRRSQMLQRLDYVYCTTACVQNHKRELMAAAALKRFG